MTNNTDVPVFGAGVDHSATLQFEVEYLDVTTREVEREKFTSWEDPGSGPVVTYLRGARADDQAAVQLAGALIFRALVDDDGLSSDYVLPTKPDENWEQTLTEWAAEGGQGEPPEWEPLLDHRYDNRWDDREQWSSARRFAYLASSSRYKVPAKVITELADWIAHRAVARPTKTPSR